MSEEPDYKAIETASGKIALKVIMTILTIGLIPLVGFTLLCLAWDDNGNNREGERILVAVCLGVFGIIVLLGMRLKTLSNRQKKTS